MKRTSIRNFIGNDTFKNIKIYKNDILEPPHDINKEKNEFYQEENSSIKIKHENINKKKRFY